MPAVPPPPHHVLRLQISGLEEKKRESIMVVANQTKSRLQLAEDALHRVQVEAEKGQFELAAKKGEQCDWVGGGGEGGVLGGAAVCVQGAGKELSAASTSWQLHRARGPAAMRLPHLTVPPPAACAHVQGSARPWRVSFRRPRPPWQSCRGSGMSWAPSWAPPKPSCRMCRTAWRPPGGAGQMGRQGGQAGGLWLAGGLAPVCSWQAVSCVALGRTFPHRLHGCIVINALAPCAPRLPALAACCRTDLASKEEALATLTSEKAELEARHNELR